MTNQIADITGGDGNVDHYSSISSTKKPSLLRSGLLRRTTTRAKKRPSAEAVCTTAKENHTNFVAATTTDVPVRKVFVSCDDAIPETSSGKDTTSGESPNNATTMARADDISPKTIRMVNGSNSNDNIQNDTINDESDSFQCHQVHHDEEFEIKNASKSDTEDDSDLNISVIESDEDESKTEVDSNQPTRVNQTHQQTNTSSATVATTNLSIVVTGSNVVVEYRDINGGERKESSRQAGLQKSSGGDAAKATSTPTATSILSTLFSPLGRRPASTTDTPSAKATSSSLHKQQSARRRPKGIMKRPRDSNLTYHHPRRPLPPPIPPPGYKEESSPMSWMTATTTDSRDFLTAPPMAITTIRKKRVSFDEALLTEQYKSSKMRRQVRYEQRRSLFGILSAIMPLILPYVIAILILVASSMVPLPSAQRQEQSSMPSQRTLPTTHPIIYDVASRMWDERTKLLESTINNDESTHSNSAAIARIGGSSLLEGSSEKSDTSKELEIVRMETSKNDIAVAQRPVYKKTMTKTMVAFLKERIEKPDTSKELEIVGMETSNSAIAVAQRPEYKNTMTKTVVAFLKERIEKSDTSKELEIVGMETSNSAIAVAQRFEHRNPVAKTVATFLKVLKAIFSPFHR